MAKARADSVKVHFKNTRETAMAIKGMKVERAVAYLKNVLKRKEIVPFRRFTGGVGHHAQQKNIPGAKNGRWPVKSVRAILALLENATANAANKDLKQERCFVSHIQVQRAPKTRRRTFRAHGRINAYMNSPSHIEIHLTERSAPVPKGSSSMVRS